MNSGVPRPESVVIQDDLLLSAGVAVKVAVNGRSNSTAVAFGDTWYSGQIVLKIDTFTP